ALAQLIIEEKNLVDVVYNGKDGLDYALSGIYDVIVLDVMLPGMNGFEVISELRNKKITTPVIMLSARDSVKDKIKGLEAGADDYMTKPFSPEELLARIKALSRRHGEVVMNELKFQDLTLNVSDYTLQGNDKSVRLGFKEFEVLKILMTNQKSIVLKEDLIRKVWGLDSDAEDNNVEAFISFLRKKIAFVKSKVIITNLRKVGYKLEVADV
ncbi:MAG: response regulator transcription factor, partial [Clostridia bacterium]|nr:response regulator transcription factor [Clostridia bacterium]